MKNKAHILIELVLIILLIIAVIRIEHARTEVNFPIQHGGNISIQMLAEKKGIPPMFVILLNDQKIAEFLAADNMYHWIKVLNKDGLGTYIQYNGRRNEPAFFARSVQIGDEFHTIVYNDSGEIEQKEVIHVNAPTSQP